MTASVVRPDASGITGACIVVAGALYVSSPEWGFVLGPERLNPPPSAVDKMN